ncbi:ABC transporter permease [uncultured Cohaesibacter sp.]|uniref:ABC transporter permease n=1 Tax=uncultured Cohaesibacter sp. TaxID=1002546 RepID=UPI00292DA040|nr:ABC transporter permease [uncultured Cohaesibacter sp.]
MLLRLTRPNEQPTASAPARSLLRRVWRHKSGRIGLILSILLVLLAAIGYVWTPYDPDLPNFALAMKPPSGTHLLGTDEMGRDVFSRIFNAAHRSIGAAFLVLACSFLIGLFVGILSGLMGGLVDTLMMRLVDIVMALPSLVLAFAILGILGPGFKNLLVALILSDWAWYARLARSLAIGSGTRPDILTAKMSGISFSRIVLTHLLPGIATKLGVMATLAFGSMIGAISGLSFLGLGVQPPHAEWGAMLSQSRLYFDIAPWLLLSPAIAILLSVLSANLIGHALRDVTEVKKQ